MTVYAVTRQPCGCILLPEDVVALLRLGPGCEFLVYADAARRSVTLNAVSPLVEGALPGERTSCPLYPEA